MLFYVLLSARGLNYAIFFNWSQRLLFGLSVPLLMLLSFSAKKHNTVSRTTCFGYGRYGRHFFLNIWVGLYYKWVWLWIFTTYKWVFLLILLIFIHTSFFCVCRILVDSRLSFLLQILDVFELRKIIPLWIVLLLLILNNLSTIKGGLSPIDMPRSVQSLTMVRFILRCIIS